MAWMLSLSETRLLSQRPQSGLAFIIFNKIYYIFFQCITDLLLFYIKCVGQNAGMFIHDGMTDNWMGGCNSLRLIIDKLLMIYDKMLFYAFNTQLSHS